MYPPQGEGYPPQGAPEYPPQGGQHYPAHGAQMFPPPVVPGYPDPGAGQQAASCYRHPTRPTRIGCQRCGRPICGECMIEAPVGFQCPECVQTGMRETRQHEVVRRQASHTTTATIIGVNLVLFAVTFLTGRTASPLFHRLALSPTGLCERGGQVFAGGDAVWCSAFGGEWLPGVADGAVWQLLTSAFMHLDITHIAFNMFALWVLGPQLETFLGRARYLGLYFVSAFAGAAFVMWFSSPAGTTVGASGALFGLMGALLVFAWRKGLDVRTILFWLGANLVFTFMIPGISWQGHLGGLVGGLASAAVLMLPKQYARWRWIGLIVLGVVFVGASLVRMAML